MAEYKSRRERRHAQGGKISSGKPAAIALIIGVPKKPKKKDGGHVEGGKARSHLGKRARGGSLTKSLDACEAAFDSDGVDKVAVGSGNDEREVPVQMRRADGGGVPKSKFEVDDDSSRDMGDLTPSKRKPDNKYTTDDPDQRARGGRANRRADGGNTPFSGAKTPDNRIDPSPATMDRNEIKKMPPKDDDKETALARGGRLTAHQRQVMPSSEFALPGKGSGPSGKGSGAYPINDPQHARSALSRVSANGSSEEQKKVREAVHRRYPGMGRG